MKKKKTKTVTKEHGRSLPCVWKKLKIVKRPVALNDTNPLWAKHPNECTDEEYKAFYRKVFHGLQGAFILDPSEYGLSV